MTELQAKLVERVIELLGEGWTIEHLEHWERLPDDWEIERDFEDEAQGFKEINWIDPDHYAHPAFDGFSEEELDQAWDTLQRARAGETDWLCQNDDLCRWGKNTFE